MCLSPLIPHPVTDYSIFLSAAPSYFPLVEAFADTAGLDETYPLVVVVHEGVIEEEWSEDMSVNALLFADAEVAVLPSSKLTK